MDLNNEAYIDSTQNAIRQNTRHTNTTTQQTKTNGTHPTVAAGRPSDINPPHANGMVSPPISIEIHIIPESSFSQGHMCYPQHRLPWHHRSHSLPTLPCIGHTHTLPPPLSGITQATKQHGDKYRSTIPTYSSPPTDPRLV
jgi:hypothetical protein